jgi:hypothetical protein
MTRAKTFGSIVVVCGDGIWEARYCGSILTWGSDRDAVVAEAGRHARRNGSVVVVE